MKNLNPVNPKQNTQKSCKLNPGRYKGKGCIPIEGRHESETEWTPYSGATEAAEELNLSKRRITEVCRGKLPHIDDYKFRYKAESDLKGEIWVKKTHVGISVSNKGRVKT